MCILKDALQRERDEAICQTSVLQSLLEDEQIRLQAGSPSKHGSPIGRKVRGQ